MPSLSELHCSYNTPFTHSLWYLKYSLCRRKQSEPESPSVLSGTFRSSDEEKQQRPTSNHVTTNHPNMSACVTRWCVGFLICKKKRKKKKKCDILRGVWWGKCHFFLKLTVQETVWLQRCYLWCSIAFCRNKNNWQIVHHSCWINHLSTSQNWLESVSCCMHTCTLMKTSQGGTSPCADVAASVTQHDTVKTLYGFYEEPCGFTHINSR